MRTTNGFLSGPWHKFFWATDAGCTSSDVLSDLGEAVYQERPFTQGPDHALWMKAVVQEGMTPMQAILAGTRSIAAAYGKLDQFGTVEAGKIADLVLLNADPLADITNVNSVHMVIKRRPHHRSTKPPGGALRHERPNGQCRAATDATSVGANVFRPAAPRDVPRVLPVGTQRLAYPTVIGSEPDHSEFYTLPLWRNAIVGAGRRQRAVNGGSEPLWRAQGAAMFHGGRSSTMPMGGSWSKPMWRGLLWTAIQVQHRHDWLDQFPLLFACRPILRPAGHRGTRRRTFRCGVAVGLKSCTVVRRLRTS
ncbi:amidohydrolase family protein [Mycolicibacterium farcinogenes]|nr:amidohydrolase family protein [Mycolicibacterium farcinogenes]